MSRLDRQSFPLDLEMGYFAATHGNVEATYSLSPSEHETHIVFVLPPVFPQLVPGRYESSDGQRSARVIISLIENGEFDPIARHGGSLFIHSKAGFPPLQINDLSDSRGKYPAIQVAVIFDIRIPEVEKEIVPPADQDAEFFDVAKSAEKLAALRILRSLIRDSAYPGHRHGIISYDDVTTFFTGCWNKKRGGWDLVRVTALASRGAYREAVVEKLIGSISLTGLIDSVRRLQREIDSERDLQGLILDALMRLKEHVEDRQWIDPFWDGEPKGQLHGKEGAHPKTEIRVHPTIYIILLELLTPLGIAVVREADVGSGLIDLACFFTNKRGQRLTVGIEVKLAHHKELRKGLRSQLPRYLRSLECTHGIFLVFWFKSLSARGFAEPKNVTLEEHTKWIHAEAESANADLKVSILPLVIDASAKAPASN